MVRHLSYCLLLAVITWLPGCAKASAGIEISDAWARPTIGSSTQGVIYLTITNKGTAADKLTAASTPAADMAELHSMDMSDGMMKMRAMPSLTIAAGETVSLSPGGDHLMLTGVKAPLKAGDVIDLTLSFEKAGDISVKVPVKNGE